MVLEKVLSFIDEPWSDDVLSYGKKKHDIPDWEAGSRDVSQTSQITEKGVGQWQSKFTNTDKRQKSKLLSKVCDGILV